MGVPAHAGDLEEARRGVGPPGVGHTPNEGGQAPVTRYRAAEDVLGLPRRGVSHRDAQDLDRGARGLHIGVRAATDVRWMAVVAGTQRGGDVLTLARLSRRPVRSAMAGSVSSKMDARVCGQLTMVVSSAKPCGTPWWALLRYNPCTGFIPVLQ